MVPRRRVACAAGSETTWRCLVEVDMGNNEGELIDYSHPANPAKWWWMLVVVTAIVIGVAYAALDRVKPRYSATATVVVSPKTPQVLADMKEFVEMPGESRRQFSDYIRTQLDIIKSQKVASAVLDTLDFGMMLGYLESPHRMNLTVSKRLRPMNYGRSGRRPWLGGLQSVYPTRS